MRTLTWHLASLPSRVWLAECRPTRLVLPPTQSYRACFLQGGALMTKGTPQQNKIEVPAPTIGLDLSTLLHDENTADVTIRLLPDDESCPSMESSQDQAAWLTANTSECKAHKLVLKVQSSLHICAAVVIARAWTWSWLSFAIPPANPCYQAKQFSVLRS
jgi:hypothetical protein